MKRVPSKDFDASAAIVNGLPNVQNVAGCVMQAERVRREKDLAAEWLDVYRKAGDKALQVEMLKMLERDRTGTPKHREMSASDWQKVPRELRPKSYPREVPAPQRYQPLRAVPLPASARDAQRLPGKAAQGHWVPTSDDYGDGRERTVSLSARAAGERVPKGTPITPAGDAANAFSYRVHGTNGLSSIDYALTQARVTCLRVARDRKREKGEGPRRHSRPALQSGGFHPHPKPF